jgi:hypothetical protein
MLWLTHAERTEYSKTFAKFRQSKMLILQGLLKKCCGWGCNGFKWLGTGWRSGMVKTKKWKTHNSLNLLTSHATLSFHWVTSDNMSLWNHHICSLLIMLRHFKIISVVRSSFSVICSEEWKGVERYTDYVKIMKKWRAYFILAVNS